MLSIATTAHTTGTTTASVFLPRSPTVAKASAANSGWNYIAVKMGNRTDSQCRRRWRTLLDRHGKALGRYGHFLLCLVLFFFVLFCFVSCCIGVFSTKPKHNPVGL
jgi:hypothetical protein